MKKIPKSALNTIAFQEPPTATTIAERLDEIHHLIVTLNGQCALLARIQRSGIESIDEREVTECAAKTADDLWEQWYWLNFNRKSFGHLPAPDDDEREAMEKFSQAGK